MTALQEAEAKVRELDAEIEKLSRLNGSNLDTQNIREELEKAKQKVLACAYENLTSYDRVYLARKSTRPNVREYMPTCLKTFLNRKGIGFTAMTKRSLAGLPPFAGMP